MGSIVINVRERLESGKKSRRHGMVPCVMYGAHIDKSIPIEAVKRDMDKLLASVKNSLFTVKLNDDTARECIVKEVQKDCFGHVIHVDFQSVDRNEKIKMKVPIVFTQEGKLSAKGLILDPLISEVELYGESDEFPNSIEYDVENLQFGDKVFAKELDIPEGFRLDVDADKLVATVQGVEAPEVTE